MKRNITSLVAALLLSTGVAFATGTQGTTAATTPAATGSMDRPSGDYFPTVYSTPQAYTQATGQTVGSYKESPYIAQMGTLPPVSQRLPREPLVIQPSEQIGTYGGTLRDPHTGNADFLEDLVREFPLMYAPDMGSINPNIFKEFRVLNGGRVYEFTIREGMKWSDGDPFDNQDFIFWYDAVANNKVISPGGVSQLKTAGEHGVAEKIGQYGLRVTFKSPSGLFLNSLARFRPLPYLPEHYMRQFHPDYATAADLDAKVRAAGFSAWNELFGEERKWPQNPNIPTIYAWKVTNRITEQVHQAERNPYYWKVDTTGNQLPYIDTLTRPNLGSSQEQLLLNALAGQADYIHPNPLGFSANYATLVQGQEQGDYQILRLYGWSNNRGAMYLNLSHPDPVLNELFNNIEFRAALSVGMDRVRMNDLTFNGTFVPSQPSPPAVPPYNGASGAYLNYTEHDLADANRRLDSLGLTWNAGRTQRMRSDGKPLQLVINVNSRFPQVVTMAELVKEDWAELGIPVTIKPMGGGIWKEQHRANLHDISMHSANMGGRVPIIGGARQPTTVLNGNWGPNPKWGSWLITGGAQGEEPPAPVKELFELGIQYSAEPDAAKRVELEKRMYAIHNENIYMLGGLHQPHDHPQEWYVYIHNRLHNISQPLAPEYYYAIPSSWYVTQ